MKYEFELKESVIRQRPSLFLAILLIMMAIASLFRGETMLGKIITTLCFAAGLLGVYRYVQHKNSPVIQKPRLVLSETGGEMTDSDNENEPVFFAWSWEDIQSIKLRFPNTTPSVEFQTENGSFYLAPAHFKDQFGMTEKLQEFCRAIPGVDRLASIATPKLYFRFLVLSYIISVVFILGLLLAIPFAVAVYHR